MFLPDIASCASVWRGHNGLPEAVPVDAVGEPVKLMPLINHVVRVVAEEVGIRGGRHSVFL